jgi:flavin reductase (DIM6/NTAB) family NADH-FMN oxidoreductase RutF
MPRRSRGAPSGCGLSSRQQAFAAERSVIKKCYANLECSLVDDSLISKYDLFIWQVLKAHVATSPKYPKTVHYRGEGVFMISGPSISLRKRFK